MQQQNADPAAKLVSQQTLESLAGHLKSISEALLSSKEENSQVRTEIAEVKSKNSALQLQLDSQRERHSGAYRFKHIGNELNFYSNIDIVTFATKALTSLELGFPDQVDARLRELIKQALKQNKCIKMADNSPAGWGLVSEYLGNSLAEDAEDERKMKRAEVACEQKYKRKLEADLSKSKGRGAGRGRSEAFEPIVGSGTAGSGEHAAHTAGPSTGGKQGPCFHCAGPHMKINCPLLKEKSSEIQAKIEALYNAAKHQ